MPSEAQAQAKRPPIGRSGFLGGRQGWQGEEQQSDDDAARERAHAATGSQETRHQLSY